MPNPSLAVPASEAKVVASGGLHQSRQDHEIKVFLVPQTSSFLSFPLTVGVLSLSPLTPSPDVRGPDAVRQSVFGRRKSFTP